MNIHRLAALHFAVSLLFACSPEKNETEGGTTTGEVSSGSETLGMSSQPTTGGEGATGTSTLTVGGTGAGTSEGGFDDDDSAEPTTAETGTDPVSCAGFCAKGEMCGADLGGESCVAFCDADLRGARPVCRAATEGLFGCLEQATCEQFVTFIDDEDPGPCSAEFDLLKEACEGEICELGAGVNRDGTECELNKACEDAAPMSMVCDEASCVCFVGERMVAECPAEGVCMELGALEDKSKECCGF